MINTIWFRFDLTRFGKDESQEMPRHQRVQDLFRSAWDMATRLLQQQNYRTRKRHVWTGRCNPAELTHFQAVIFLGNHFYQYIFMLLMKLSRRLWWLFLKLQFNFIIDDAAIWTEFNCFHEFSLCFGTIFRLFWN